MFGKSSSAAQKPAAQTSMTENEKSSAAVKQPTGWRKWLSSGKKAEEASSIDSAEEYKDEAPREKWSLGILNDKHTEEVPGKRAFLAF